MYIHISMYSRYTYMYTIQVESANTYRQADYLRNCQSWKELSNSMQWYDNVK